MEGNGLVRGFTVATAVTWHLCGRLNITTAVFAKGVLRQYFIDSTVHCTQYSLVCTAFGVTHYQQLSYDVELGSMCSVSRH